MKNRKERFKKNRISLQASRLVADIPGKFQKLAYRSVFHDLLRGINPKRSLYTLKLIAFVAIPFQRAMKASPFYSDPQTEQARKDADLVVGLNPIAFSHLQVENLESLESQMQTMGRTLGERHAELKRKMVSVGQAEMKKCASMINTRPFEPERVILTSFENRKLDFDLREPKEEKK